MNTHNSRLSAEHYLLAKRVLRFLDGKREPVSNVTIFSHVGQDVSGDHQKKVMKFLRQRRLVTIQGRSRWALYSLAEDYRAGRRALPPRIDVSEKRKAAARGPCKSVGPNPLLDPAPAEEKPTRRIHGGGTYSF